MHGITLIELRSEMISVLYLQKQHKRKLAEERMCNNKRYKKLKNDLPFPFLVMQEQGATK